MGTNQPIMKKSFTPGSSRPTRSVHSLALRIAEELDLQLTEEEDARRLATAQRLRDLRGIRSQQWVADRVGVTSRAVQAWEAGGGVSSENIEALAKLYKVSENFLLYGTDTRPTPDQVAEILSLLRSLDERMGRVEELLSERELEDLEGEAETETPPTRKPAGRRAANGA
jgi:transcriptional regulator with XRE-family HTH domain